MKKLVSLIVGCVVCLLAMSDSFSLAVVRHRWQEVITESNHAALRPGSVYDILTHFEQDGGLTRPHFNYLFFDTGLGAADPIYPVFQTGYQESWPQLIKAGLSEDNRHLDHFSTGRHAGRLPDPIRLLGPPHQRISGHVRQIPRGRLYARRYQLRLLREASARCAMRQTQSPRPERELRSVCRHLRLC